MITQTSQSTVAFVSQAFLFITKNALWQPDGKKFVVRELEPKFDELQSIYKQFRPQAKLISIKKAIARLGFRRKEVKNGEIVYHHDASFYDWECPWTFTRDCPPDPERVCPKPRQEEYLRKKGKVVPIGRKNRKKSKHLGVPMSTHSSSSLSLSGSSSGSISSSSSHDLSSASAASSANGSNASNSGMMMSGRTGSTSAQSGSVKQQAINYYEAASTSTSVGSVQSYTVYQPISNNNNNNNTNNFGNTQTQTSGDIFYDIFSNPYDQRAAMYAPWASTQGNNILPEHPVGNFGSMVMSQQVQPVPMYEKSCMPSKDFSPISDCSYSDESFSTPSSPSEISSTRSSLSLMSEDSNHEPSLYDPLLDFSSADHTFAANDHSLSRETKSVYSVLSSESQQRHQQHFTTPFAQAQFAQPRQDMVMPWGSSANLTDEDFGLFLSELETGVFI